MDFHRFYCFRIESLLKKSDRLTEGTVLKFIRVISIIK